MDRLLEAIGQWQELRQLGDIALAMLLGGVIGIEREFARKPAGLRTLMLVAGAAALLVTLSQLLVESFDAETGNASRPDPVRVVHAIVIGVSFLGAGTIYRNHGHEVEGLTTSASILMAAAVGIAVALGEYALAAGVAVLVPLVVLTLGRLEYILLRHRANDSARGELVPLREPLSKERRKGVVSDSDGT